VAAKSFHSYKIVYTPEKFNLVAISDFGVAQLEVAGSTTVICSWGILFPILG